LTIQSVLSDVIVCPNPFYPPRQNYIYFRLPEANQQSATLTVLTPSMDQIVAKEFLLKTTACRQGAELEGGQGLQWDGLDNNQALVPSGIYFYVINVDDKQYMGKFSVIRE
ncbi:MAG: hypothetical protein HY277_02530, partial [Ignavibacteriales bacterium]|nr:hypothetical protein [Ignavibacteriales bacterium]